MRKLILQMQFSIDGFVGGPNGEIDWIFKSMDRALTDWIVDHLWKAGLHIMGRRTFQDMIAYWPTSTEPFAAPMNEIPKAVFTKQGFSISQGGEVTQAFKDATRIRIADGMNTSQMLTPSTTTWTNATIVSGDLSQEISRLKNESGKDILAHGGAGFAQSLVKTGLIDEYRLIVHPMALGNGLPLFSTLQKPLHLRLISSTAFDTGAVAQVYQPT